MRVLQSFPTGHRTTNPYLIQLSRHLGPEPEVLGFSWRKALTAEYDVLHAHWPDALLRGPTATRSVVRRLLFRVLLLRLRLRRYRTAVVRTLYDLPGHDTKNRSERVLLDRFDQQTTLWIRLNPTTAVPDGAPVRTIEHGDYSGWFDITRPGPSVPGRLVYFGVIRPTKGVPDLVQAFTALRTGPDGDPVSIRVLGSPVSIDIGAEVMLAARGDDRVTVTLGHPTDTELAAETAQAELVVLPYRDMHDSGSAVLALSLERPVLVPSTPVTEALRTEVGHDWVFTYIGPLSAAVLSDALAWCRSNRRSDPASRPDLSARSWPVVSAKHREAYSAAVALVQPRGRVNVVEQTEHAAVVDADVHPAIVPQGE